MKISIALSTVLVTLFALFAKAVSANGGFGVAVFTKDPEKHPKGECSARDDTFIMNLIGEAIMDATPDMWEDNGDGRRLGSDGRRLNWWGNMDPPGPWCGYLCEYWAEGTCHYAYPWCWPWRRNLRSEEVKPEEGDVELEEFESPDCAKALVAVEDKLLKSAQLIKNKRCSEYLTDNHTFKCLRLKQN